MSVKKYSLSVVVQCVLVTCLYSQQMPQISHYMFNPQMYNPASVGFSNSILASGIHRQQWYGMEGAPQTTIISIDAPLRIIKSGVGLNITNDQIGWFNNTYIQLAYNYQLPFLNGTLGMGIQAGMNNFGLKLTDIRPPETPNDIVLQNKDDASRFLFDVSLGLFYQVLNQYEIGISLGHLNAPRSPDLHYQQARCLNLSGNYHFTLDLFPKIDFVPSTLIKTDFSSTQIDLSLVGVYDKQYWAGISCRLGEVVLMGGLFIKQMQVGLAYDLATNWMFKSSKIGGSFEIFARYAFNLSVDRIPKSYKNSRYL
ncbi:MAG: PorP/SprF family type IX secretion system membrane protein [Bacteroidales bacterium]|nr:PorP/SprF family type IX secretion system membrane protein [Bacteroidales bacterium]